MRPGFAVPLLTALFAILLSAVPGWAQSTFSSRGLGYELDPIDARARGLGGVALGFPDPQLSWVNPADAIGLPEPGVVIGYQYDSFDTEAAGGTVEGNTARFPILMAAFPAGRWVLMAGYGGFLDQNWSVERPDSLILAQDVVRFTDIVSSEGGVARLRAGVAYQVITQLGVGIGLDAYTGDVARIRRRLFEFDDEASLPCCRSAWNYSGLGVTAGARFVPNEALTVSGSLGYGGSLDAEITSGEGAAASYDLPTKLRAGATGRIGQATLLALGGSWGGWSTLNDVLADEGGARDGWSIEGGLEYEGLTILERAVPLRIGGRTAALPFRWTGVGTEEWAGERVLSVGSGVVLAGGATRTDLSVEFGSRGGEESGLDESFWRLGFSVRVLGR
jgi:hypothetical protein